jgi:hypothetical protein
MPANINQPKNWKSQYFDMFLKYRSMHFKAIQLNKKGKMVFYRRLFRPVDW